MSSYELSKLFSFNYFQDKSVFSNETKRKSNLDLLNKACNERLFKFVTHKNSQVRIQQYKIYTVHTTQV